MKNTKINMIVIALAAAMLATGCSNTAQSSSEETASKTSVTVTDKCSDENTATDTTQTADSESSDDNTSTEIKNVEKARAAPFRLQTLLLAASSMQVICSQTVT